MSAVNTLLYVAGPMSGIDHWNRPAFEDAQARLRDAGFDISSPLDNQEAGGYEWHACLRIGLQHMLLCDGVATLDGWQRSRGATLEVFMACQVAIDVRSVAEWIREGV